MQNYTTIEQSKKLLELGLNPNTADMCWTNHLYGNVRSSMKAANMTIDDYKKLLDSFADSTSIDIFYPCWSLGALLELLPICSTIDHESNGWWCNVNYDIVDIKNGFTDNSIKEKILFEAVYDMVVWLLVRNYI